MRLFYRQWQENETSSYIYRFVDSVLTFSLPPILLQTVFRMASTGQPSLHDVGRNLLLLSFVINGAFETRNLIHAHFD